MGIGVCVYVCMCVCVFEYKVIYVCILTTKSGDKTDFSLAKKSSMGKEPQTPSWALKLITKWWELEYDKSKHDTIPW